MPQRSGTVTLESEWLQRAKWISTSKAKYESEVGRKAPNWANFY